MVRVQELRTEAGHEEGKILTWTADLETKRRVFGKISDGLNVTIKEFKTAA